MSATSLEKFLIVPGLIQVIVKTLFAFITSPFRGSNGAPTVLEHVWNTALRTLFNTLTVSQLQLILPTFSKTYHAWSKAHNVPVDIVPIPNTNITGFWIGSKESARYVTIYFHGGGFVIDGGRPHLDLLLRMNTWSDGNHAAFCPCYTLAPEGLYPLQIAECVEALRYVLSMPGRRPSNVLLGGDSAGGNLVLAVLSHVSRHPHPNQNVVKPLHVEEPLHGAFVIAPWVSSDATRFQSMTAFANRDIVNPKCANLWMETYTGRGQGIVVKDDEYIAPELATADWWKDTKVSNMLVLAGEHEFLRDAILAWAKKFQAGPGATVFKIAIGKREVHIAPLTAKPEDVLDKLGGDCQEAVLRDWAKANLKPK
ncbi:uncharacterized protein Z519_03028 [Cladophialophora bantiana CBS 173.52]|uniref:Alpha/beta hydrolase fold-3 domain-containing protein n=1 Tax=Cladophialophora bantiana (strain ATCC 10958 / CBS 173.52 / CDC B-1940 / NIH 8579) TaxID=1442370 RepID=A0A0D2GBP9_CLAB1|nr:uncharacterized protein Z519_03028 [Cladophialophora bantiana CBS 173.52]KIW95962.1 hypothetical protein Z519_03028 [Cladophialophora bantiana CBS 173.52]